MDALFGGCSIAGALIASGGYQFEPLVPSSTLYESYPGGYRYRVITEHEIFIVLIRSYGAAGAGIAHSDVWLGVGSSALVYGTTGRTVDVSTEPMDFTCMVLDNHTIQFAIAYSNTVPYPALGYIYRA